MLLFAPRESECCRSAYGQLPMVQRVPHQHAWGLPAIGSQLRLLNRWANSPQPCWCSRTKDKGTCWVQSNVCAVRENGEPMRTKPTPTTYLEKTTMTLTEYFEHEPRGAKAEMAEYLKITPTWLSQLMKGERRASAALCMKIEKATQGLVKRKDLRPDLFGSAKS